MLGFHAISEAPISALAGVGDIVLSIEGNATATIAENFVAHIGGSTEANATLSAVFRRTLEVEAPLLEGNATTVLPEFKITVFMTPDLAVGEATGSISLTSRSQLTPELPVIGEAEIANNLELIRPVINPELAAQLVDVSDNSVFKLTVASTLLDFTGTALFQADELNVSYESKVLTFSEIATPQLGGIGFPSFDPEDSVTLDIDWDQDTLLERVFTGKIKTRTTNGENNREGFIYTAVGNQQLANEYTLVSTDGRPRVEFTVGTTVTSITSTGTEISTAFSKDIADAVQELFVISAPGLNTFSIPSTIGIPGLEQLTGQLPESVVLENLGFQAALQRLVSFERGIKIFWDDPQQAWTFPNILNSTTAKVDISSVNLESAVFDVSTSDRYTAVRLYARTDTILDENIITQSETFTIDGKTGTIVRASVELTPAWDAALAATWTLFATYATTFSFLQGPVAGVFKRWTLPPTLVPPIPGTPVNAYQEYIDVSSRRVVRRLGGKANFQRREFISNFPALAPQSNPYDSRLSLGPEKVRLEYYPLQFSFTFPTSTTSEGSPTSFVNTLLDSTEFLDTIRIPDTGFEGTAFTLFNVQNEYVELVDKTEVTTKNAQRILEQYRDVTIEGDLPFGGDPIRQFINLDIKLRLEHQTLSTGIESITATVTQYTYTFGKRGRSNLSMTTDISGLVSAR